MRFKLQVIRQLGISQAFLAADNSNQTARVHVDKGYIVQAVENEVYVALRVKQTFQAAALVSKGGAALGTQFRVVGFTNYNSDDSMSHLLVSWELKLEPHLL